MPQIIAKISIQFLMNLKILFIDDTTVKQSGRTAIGLTTAFFYCAERDYCSLATASLIRFALSRSLSSLVA